MRVAQVNDIAYVATTFARVLTRMGHEVDVIEPRRLVTRLRYPWRLATVALRAAGLVEAAVRVRRSGYDVAHVHFARLGIVGPLSGLPYVLHCHGTDVRGVRPRSLWGMEIAPALRSAGVVYYATPDLAPWVRAFRSDAVFLPNPIELERFRPAGRSPKADLLVGARLDPIKGREQILRLVARVLEFRPRTTVTIIDQGTGVARARAALGASAVVIPRVPHDRVAELYGAHRVAIGQRLVGALGNYELEAMASGLPVATEFRYPDAYVTPPPVIGGSPDSAAREVASLLDDDEARLAVGQRARAWIAAHHDARAIAARVVDDYLAISSA